MAQQASPNCIHISEPVRAQAMRLSAEATRNPLSESWWLALAKNGSSTLRAGVSFWGGVTIAGLLSSIRALPFQVIDKADRKDGKDRSKGGGRCRTDRTPDNEFRSSLLLGIDVIPSLPNPSQTLSAEASRRLLWLGFEVHYLAHLIVCGIGRIQPDHPALSTFYIGKESPMSRATTVAEFVELKRG